MSLSLLGAFLLASTVSSTAASGYENARFVSPNGEMVVVVRRFPRIGDFDRVDPDAYHKMVQAEEEPDLVPLPDERPPEPEPTRGALYHVWPGGYRELLAEVAFRRGESLERLLVANDGSFVTHPILQCGRDEELLTIRDAGAEVVRTLLARDVLTANDQQWLCRGEWNDVRYAIDGETLRMTMLVTDGRWEDHEARFHTVDIELATGDAPAPGDDHCPPTVRVLPESDDGLLSRATVRVIPEYPVVAMKARISGVVIVKVVVGRDGRVESADVVKPLPFGLDQAVRDAIVKWEFTPAAGSVSGMILFRFEILRPFRITTVS